MNYEYNLTDEDLTFELLAGDMSTQRWWEFLPLLIMRKDVVFKEYSHNSVVLVSTKTFALGGDEYPAGTNIRISQDSDNEFHDYIFSVLKDVQ